MTLKLPWVARRERAIEEAVAERTRKVKEETVAELARAMGGTMLAPQVPASYPQTNGSPYPLYGLDQPMTWATPQSPKKRPNTVVTTDTLRNFANSYDILRSCINQLKREVQAEKFVIGPKDAKDDSPRMQTRIRKAEEFFTKRGGLGEINETRRHYEAKIFEDVLVIGALGVWKNKTRARELVQALPIDAATIRPRMDAFGWPGPGDDWYEQWIQGMKITGFPPDEFVYDGLWPMTDSPYFRSPVEYLISTTVSALKSDGWNQAWLTTGNTPSDTYFLPAEWTPEQCIIYADYFDAKLAGNTKERQKTKFMPGALAGANRGQTARKDHDFAQFDLWLLRRTCAIYGVQPASIGFAGEQYKVSQENSTDQTTQFGTGSLLALRKEHYDDLLEDLGFDDLEVQDGKAAETALQRTERVVKAMGGVGPMSMAEGRKALELDAREGTDVIFVPNTVRPLDQALQPPEPAADPNATGAADTSAEDVARWMRKSLKRLKERGIALCEFESDSIPAETAETIRRGLATANTPDQVRAVFAL